MEKATSKIRENIANLQSMTRMVRGGQYISCSGSSTSSHFTIAEKFGFFLALEMMELWRTWPPHSMSTRGWFTGRNWIFLRSRSPQNRTSNLSVLVTSSK